MRGASILLAALLALSACASDSLSVDGCLTPGDISSWRVIHNDTDSVSMTGCPSTATVILGSAGSVWFSYSVYHAASCTMSGSITTDCDPAQSTFTFGCGHDPDRAVFPAASGTRTSTASPPDPFDFIVGLQTAYQYPCSVTLSDVSISPTE